MKTIVVNVFQKYLQISINICIFAEDWNILGLNLNILSSRIEDYGVPNTPKDPVRS